MIHPADIIEVVKYGTGDMGDVTDPESAARFGLPCAEQGFALKSLWIRAISGSDGDAELNLWIDHRRGAVYDWIPLMWPRFGLGSETDVESEIFMRIQPDNLGDFTCWRDPSTGMLDEFCLAWTNPTDIKWSAGFRLIPIDRIPRDGV